MRSIGNYLKPLVEAEGGIFALSGTVEDTLTMLSQSPGRWRCLCQWQREQAQGSTRTAVQATFLFIVQQAKGLHVNPGQDVQDKRGADPALLDRAEFVQQAMRACRFNHPQIDAAGFMLGSRYWLSDPRFPTRQIAMEFTLLFGCDSKELVAAPVASSGLGLQLHGGGDLELHDGRPLEPHT